MPKVLIADKLSPAAVAISLDRCRRCSNGVLARRSMSLTDRFISGTGSNLS